MSGEVSTARAATSTVTWQMYEASVSEVCAALGIPVRSRAEVTLEATDNGVKVTVKSLS